jgi:methanogenic corrinoid protein MtbC1
MNPSFELWNAPLEAELWRGWGLSDAAAESSPEGVSGQVIARMIEREIIPRLLLSRRAPRRSPRRANRGLRGITPADIEIGAELALAGAPGALLDHVQGVADRGVKLPLVYLNLLAPIARRLGVMWENDSCTFIDLSIGLSRLQHALHEIGRQNDTNFRNPAPERRILLAAAPGEHHTFGLSMVEKFFIQARWETQCGHAAPASAIIESLKRSRMDAVGFSIGSEGLFDPLRALIEAVRKTSRNPDIAILVGGKFVADHPECASSCPEASFVSDGNHAVATAERLIARIPQRAALPLSA